MITIKIIINAIKLNNLVSRNDFQSVVFIGEYQIIIAFIDFAFTRDKRLAPQTVKNIITFCNSNKLANPVIKRMIFLPNSVVLQ